MSYLGEGMPAEGKLTFDEELAEELAKYYADPLGYVMFSFPWHDEPAIRLVPLHKRYHDRFDSEFGPDEWACIFLDDLGEEIGRRGFDGAHSVDPIMFSTSSGHGIGKSVLVAWLTKFILDTRPFSRGIITANTAEQLRTKTWAEVGKWHKLSLTRDWFNYSSGRGAMSLVHKKYAQEWRADAQTSREENSEAFAGLHAANSTPFYIFDEASAVPTKIFEVREGGTTDGEPMVFDFGNPTRNTGAFFENCVGKFRHRYNVRSIDSRSVYITNKKRIQQWVDDYGEESDFVKVRVRGVFPSAGTLQFIATEVAADAAAREVKVDKTAALVIGVDVARFGNDQTVIYPRIGDDARSFEPVRINGADTVQVTGRVIRMIQDFRALGMECAGLFVDGGGIGAGVVDQLNHLGYGPIEVQFGGKPIDGTLYRFRVDEMWGRMREALKTRLAIPPLTTQTGADLQRQLTQREYGYTQAGNKLNLESKDDMKERVGGDFASPDIADALALTFAMDVAPRSVTQSTPNAGVVQFDYDPYKMQTTDDLH